MNPETTLTNDQITDIFRRHGLSAKRIRRITTGFTNEVHEVDGYILKVCIKEENEPQFKKETFLYEALKGKVAVPELVAIEISKTPINSYYMIYRKIEGEPLASHWHKLTNEQRKELIKQFCEQLKLIATFDRDKYAEVCHVESNLNWQQHHLAQIRKWQALVTEKRLFGPEKLKAVDEFVSQYQHVLKPQHLAVTYWDVHFDNVLVDHNMNFAGLIDFESVDIVSIDYILATVRRMAQEPHRYLSLEMETFAKKADYAHLMEWYQGFYPELFDFPELERRLDLYDLADILRLRVYFPNESEERLDRVLQSASIA